MIDKNAFDGSNVLGPRTFAELTGRNKVWAAKPGPVSRRDRPCPNCGEAEAELLWRTANPEPGVWGWDYSRCKKCGMVYTKNAPTPEELDRVYREAPAQQAWVALQQNQVELETDRPKFRWALEKIGWPGEGVASILDIGCSTGTLLEVADSMALARERLICGVEINKKAAEICRKRQADRPSLVKGFWLDDTLGGVPGPFKVVVLWEVLEHVLEPKAMLSRAWELVAPGGKLVICVPNFGSYAVRVLREHAPCFGLGHLNMWSPDTLDELLDSLSPKWSDMKLETIISWQREVANWMAGRPPLSSDAWDVPGGLVPMMEEIHAALAGYKLVAFVGKPS